MAAYLSPSDDFTCEKDVFYPAVSAVGEALPSTVSIRVCGVTGVARCSAAVDLCADATRNAAEVFVKNFRAMDQAVQVLALRCWRVMMFSVVSLPHGSVTRRDLVAKMLSAGACCRSLW